MSTDAPIILAFDTSAAHCAVALLRGDALLASAAEEMTRGQAERLMPMVMEVLRHAGVPLAEVGRIGVGIGPGNFTGLRIAVSAARGLALARGIPAIGVSTFEVIHLGAPGVLAGVPAPRGQLYVMAPGEEPRQVAQEEAPDAVLPPAPATLAEAIARIAATKAPGARPAPLYLRPADAAPARDAPPRLLDDA